MAQNVSDPTATAAPVVSVSGARWALALLLCMNMFNYIDRQMLAAVEPEIRRSLLPDDPDPRWKTGLLASAFLISYMLSAPLFGILAERWSRWAIIALGIALWSLASGASGLAGTFALLLITRCFVGLGEGAYGPVAPALLSDYFPVTIRGRIMAWFYVAIPVGGALGYAIGDYFKSLDEAAESWRWAFYAVVVPGLLLAVVALLTREPKRGASEGIAAPPRRPALGDYLSLFRVPSYVFNTLGMTAATFSIGALAFWMPDYLETNKVEPLWGIGPRTFFGILTALAGLLGTIGGGLCGDWLRRWFPGSYFLVSGVGLLISVPCALLFLVVPFPHAWIFVFLTVLLVFFNTGPTNTILANVVHPSLRPAGFALNILIIHALGDVPSPSVVGAIADRWGHTIGFGLVALVLGLGGMFWLWGAQYLDQDTRLAPSRSP